MSDRLKGNMMLLLTAMMWGGGFVAQSAGMDYIGPFTFCAARYVLALVALIPVVLLFSVQARKKPQASVWERFVPDKVTMWGGLYCGLTLGVADALQQVGICYTTAGKAGFITALYIIMVPLLGRIVGQRIPKVLAFCVLLAIVGFYFLCVNEELSVGYGDFLTLCCAVFFSLHILVIDYFMKRKADGIKLSWVQFAVAFVFASCLVSGFEAVSWESLWAARVPLLFAGVISSGIAYTLQILGQKYTDPTIATLLMSLEAVFAVIAGWAVLGEVMNGRELGGCALVFIAVLLAQLPLPALKR